MVIGFSLICIFSSNNRILVEKHIVIALDLDETLIHASPCQLNQVEDFRFENHYIYVRPYINEFIKKCGQIYNLAIWSSAGEDYVHTIVNKIIPPHIDLTFICKGR